MKLLIVVAALVNALACPDDFFATRCEEMDLAETNPELSESGGNRTICALLLNPDNTYDAVPGRVMARPCRSVQYVIPNMRYDLQYIKKCGNYVYKVVESPDPAEINSIVFYSTKDKGPNPSYYAGVTCKNGKPIHGYIQISKPLTPKQIETLSDTYGIEITRDEIDECLEAAEDSQ